MAIGRKSIFSTEEKKFILENYSKMDTYLLVEKLSKTIEQITGFANNNGLKKENRRLKTEYEKEYITKWYNIKTNSEIAKHLNMTVKSVNDFAYNKGLKRDVSRYSVNEEFFKKINTEEKAYWLGFLYADGCVLENYKKGKLKGYVLELTLADKDKNHIEKFLYDIKSNIPLKEKKTKNFKSWRVSVCNTKLCKDLINLGCVPRKSLVLNFPKKDIIPEEFKVHFIRGYFDGDGCIHINRENKTYSVSFVGTQEFLYEIRETFNKELNLRKNKIRKINNAYEIRWNGKNNIKKIYNYLYGDSNCFLDRKREVFDKLPDIK